MMKLSPDLLLLMGLCFVSNYTTEISAYSTDGYILSVGQVFEVEEGATVKLPCQTNGPQCVVMWKRKLDFRGKVGSLIMGNLLQTSNSRFSYNFSNCTFTITRLKIADSGQYTCTLLDSYDSSDSSPTNITHTVIVNPKNLRTTVDAQIWPTGMRYYFDKSVGSEILFVCHGLGNPKPRVYWMRYNKLNGSIILENEVLSYSNLTMDHDGNYSCIARQGGNFDAQTIRLRVHEPIPPEGQTTASVLPQASDIQVGTTVVEPSQVESKESRAQDNTCSSGGGYENVFIITALTIITIIIMR